MLKRLSSSMTVQVDHPPLTLSMYALAAASYALSGLVLDVPSDQGGRKMEVDNDPQVSNGRETCSMTRRESRMTTLEGRETTPRQLLWLSEHALRVFESSGTPFDLEYVEACILQVLCGLYGGSVVGNGRKAGLECGVFANVRNHSRISRFGC